MAAVAGGDKQKEDDAMTGSPRPTRWWKAQAAVLEAAVKVLFDDAEFCAGFDTAVAFGLQTNRLRQAAERRAANLSALGEMGEAAILRGQGKVFVDRVREMAQSHLSALVVAATSASPRLRQVLGEGGLTHFVSALVVAVALDDAGAGREAALKLLEEMAPATLEHVPGSSISIVHQGDDGALLLNVPPGTTREEHLVVANYERSLRPEGRPGRRKRAKDRKPRRRVLDLDMAELAWKSLQKPGVTRKAVISRLWPDLDPSSSKARGRLSRLLERYTKTLPAA